MKKLLALGVVVAALSLIGCSASDKVNPLVHQDTVSNTNNQVKMGKHFKQKKCKKVKVDKLGAAEPAKAEVAK